MNSLVHMTGGVQNTTRQYQIRCFDLFETRPAVSHDTINHQRPTRATSTRELNIPKVSPEIYDLPNTQSDQHPHSAKSKPLHALVGALVGIPQLLFAGPQVLHLVDNLRHHLLNTTQISFNGLELLRGLNAGPVTGVGANLDIELDRLVGVRNTIWTRSDQLPSQKQSSQVEVSCAAKKSKRKTHDEKPAYSQSKHQTKCPQQR